MRFSSGKRLKCRAIVASTGVSGRTKCGKYSESHGCGVGGDVGVGVDGDTFTTFGDVVGDIRPPKKYARGSDD